MYQGGFALRSGNPGGEFYHIFRDVRIQYLGTGELGVLFLHPVDKSTPEAKRIHRVWFNYEVRFPVLALPVLICRLISSEVAPRLECKRRRDLQRLRRKGINWHMQDKEHRSVAVEYRGVQPNDTVRERCATARILESRHSTSWHPAVQIDCAVESFRHVQKFLTRLGNSLHVNPHTLGFR